MRGLRGVLTVAALIAGDLLAVAASYMLGYSIRGLLDTVLGNQPGSVLPLAMLANKVYLLAVYPLVFAYEGLYSKRLSGWEETRRYIRGMLVASAAVTIVFFMTRVWIVSRFVVLAAALLGVVLVPLFRALLKRALAASGLSRQPLVLLGSGEMGTLFERELARHRALGYRVVQRLGKESGNAGIVRLLAESRITKGAQLAVLSDAFTPDEMKQVFEHAERTFSDLLVIPNSSLLQSSAAEVEQIGSLLVMKYHYNLLSPSNTITKRAFDLAFGSLLLVLAAPLLGLLALAVRLSSPGPIFFRQPRIGRGRRVFSCLKFRTMYVDAEARLQDLLRSEPAIRQEWERYARITNDPRVTPAGRVLRRFSLDELPQLANVLRGEMALVGPRPYLSSEADRIGEYLDTIVRVRPGMTGLWQVSGRAALPFAERMILDEYYIKNWSLWMDFSIILRTARAVFGGRGAY